MILRPQRDAFLSRESTLLVRVRAAYCKKYVTSKKQYWGRGYGCAAILVYTDVSCQCCHCRGLAHGARGAGCRRRRGPQGPGRRPIRLKLIDTVARLKVFNDIIAQHKTIGDWMIKKPKVRLPRPVEAGSRSPSGG